MEKLFNQSVVWEEVLPADTSLSEERTETHRLHKVRISALTEGRSTDSLGWRSADSSVLYFLVGYSTLDGTEEVPIFTEGDRITTAYGKTMTVVSCYNFYGLEKGLHHLEVTLR